MHLFPMLIFFNMVSSQSDETGILDILEIEFFAKKKKKIFLWIYTLVMVTVTFLRKDKKIKVI